MKIELNRIEEPHVFQMKNETGVICTFDGTELELLLPLNR
jgi:hypothetical protein